MVRFAIVGTGRISDWILKGALQDPRLKAVAVCSRRKESAREFVLRHPEAFGPDALLFDSIEELASCSDIDAVYIGTPNTTHCSYALACLRKGKAVLCEKPLACSEEEVLEMIAAARESGSLLMEAMISTLNPNFVRARNLISEIGPVRRYSSSFCQYSSKYNALRQGTVASSFNPQMGGGALADIGIYTVYPMVSLFGPASKVSAESLLFDTAYGPVDIQGSILASYQDMTADLTYSKVTDSFLPTEICGENGNIILDACHICRRVEFVPHGAPSSGRGKMNSRETVCEGLDYDEYYYEFKEFIDLYEKGLTESSINSLAVSLECRRIMDRAACLNK